ncbi:ketoacyl-ACP synthase III [bacterium]|nr:ketoacyl-ACP synthase III [bacterium]
MIKNIKIEKIDFYLPEIILPNSELGNIFTDWDSEKVESGTGIKERRISAEDETALDMAEKAGQMLLSSYDKSSIDFLILCTQSPEYYLPTGACILQDRLGLKVNTGAFDFNLGCSGFVYGLAVAKGLILSGSAKKILFITSDTMSKHVFEKDKGNRILFGDAAAGVIISPSDSEGVGQFVFGTDGSGYKNLIVPNGGLRHRFDPKAPEESVPGTDSIRTDNYLYMNGPEIFNFTIDVVPKTVYDVLKKNKLSIDQVDYFVFHQANKFIINYLRKKLKIPENKFFIDLEETGNTVSSSIPIGLKKLQNKGAIGKGSKVLVCGFGVGYSWAATIINL